MNKTQKFTKSKIYRYIFGISFVIVIILGTLIFTCYKSLRAENRQMLNKIENVIVDNDLMSKELTATKMDTKKCEEKTEEKVEKQDEKWLNFWLKNHRKWKKNNGVGSVFDL